MHSAVNHDLIARIAAFSLPSVAIEALTNQDEWHEFLPLSFLLVQSMRPQRILEVGTRMGDSYLSFCQAVESYSLSTQCRCIPQVKSIFEREAARQWQEFQWKHDSRFSRFSRIGTRIPVQEEMYLFDLVHVITSPSAAEFENLCLTWLSRLDPSGVALISGSGQFEQSQLKANLNRIRSPFCSRILQMRNWIAIISKQPIGIVRDLLLSSISKFDLGAAALRQLGEHVLSEREAQRLRRAASAHLSEITHLRQAAAAHISEITQLQQAAAAHLSEITHLRQAADASTSELETLKSRLASVEEAEVDAQVRWGATDLLLGHIWAEKEDLRERLAEIESGAQPPRDEPALSPHASTQTDDWYRQGANPILLQLYRRYCGELKSIAPPGREFWDECGRSILTEILAQRIRLPFPSPVQPDVSIIVVLRNKAHLSVLGLCALLLGISERYELLIVDNGSSDETSELLSLVHSATTIRNNDNLGFGPAVVQAVSRASGEYLCFLNNDALLQQRALARSLALFSERPDTGGVGGKVLLADGKLQEAGCIVWRDGRALQYGRGQDPNLVQYSFRRPVDYCSGVFLVTPRRLFESLGGFDQRYAPAYYEDTDYCMKLWEMRRPVLYEPRAVIHHYEGTSKLSEAAGREGVLTNHRKFCERWRATLRLHQVDRPENLARARFAAQSGCRRCTYFLGELPINSAMALRDRRLQHVAQLVGDGYIVSCLHSGEDDPSDSNNYVPVDVELRRLLSMELDEINNYCRASDMIVVSGQFASSIEIRQIIEAHSSKVTQVEAVT